MTRRQGPRRPGGSSRSQGAAPGPARRARPGDVRTDDGCQVEGRRAVTELLRAGRRRVRRILVVTGSVAADDELGEALALAGRSRVVVEEVEADELRRIARTEAPQGVIAFADPVPLHDLAGLLEMAGDGTPFLVVLDGVTDPRNLGAVMRSALAAGSTGLILGRHRSSPLTPSAMKAAAGAAEYLPLAVVGGIPAALTTLDRHGIWTVGLLPEAEQTLWDLGLAEAPLALVLGSEGRGLSPLSARRCRITVSIPMTGAGPASLNVSAAAAVACFEIARRRSTS